MNSKSTGQQILTQIKAHIERCPKCIPGIYYCPEKQVMDHLLAKSDQKTR